MKKVQLHELPEQVLLTGKEPLSVEYNGRVLGHFYPVVQKSKEEMDALWEQFEKVLEQVMKETGLDEEGLVEALAPKKVKNREVSA